MKSGIYATHEDLPDEAFITLDERKTGIELLEQQFFLLGLHFLHRRERITTAVLDSVAIESLNQNKYDAMQFQLLFTGRTNRKQNQAANVRSFNSAAAKTSAAKTGAVQQAA